MVDRYLEDGIIEGRLDDAYEQNTADAYPPLTAMKPWLLPTGVISVTTHPA